MVGGDDAVGGPLPAPGSPPRGRSSGGDPQVVGVRLPATPPSPRTAYRLGAVHHHIAECFRFRPVAAHRPVTPADPLPHLHLVTPHRFPRVVRPRRQQQQPRLRPRRQPHIPADPIQPLPTLRPSGPTRRPVRGRPVPDLLVRDPIVYRASHAATPTTSPTEDSRLAAGGCQAATSSTYQTPRRPAGRPAAIRARRAGTVPPHTPNRYPRTSSSAKPAHKHNSATGQPSHTPPGPPDPLRPPKNPSQPACAHAAQPCQRPSASTNTVDTSTTASSKLVEEHRRPQGLPSATQPRYDQDQRFWWMRFP